MMDGAAIAVVVGAVLVAPGLMLGAVLYRFDEGKVQRLDPPVWAARPRVLWLVASAAALVAGTVELAYGRGSLVAARWGIAVALCVLTAWSDFQEEVVPNGFVAVTAALALACVACEVASAPELWRPFVWQVALGAVCASGVFLLSRLITRDGVGLGDVKLFGSLGLLLGFRGVINVLVYAMLAAFLASVTMLVTKRKSVSDRVPLGPFVLAGLVLSVGFGA